MGGFAFLEKYVEFFVFKPSANLFGEALGTGSLIAVNDGNILNFHTLYRLGRRANEVKEKGQFCQMHCCLFYRQEPVILSEAKDLSLSLSLGSQLSVLGTVPVSVTVTVPVCQIVCLPVCPVPAQILRFAQDDG